MLISNVITLKTAFCCYKNSLLHTDTKFRLNINHKKNIFLVVCNPPRHALYQITKTQLTLGVNTKTGYLIRHESIKLIFNPSSSNTYC